MKAKVFYKEYFDEYEDLGEFRSSQGVAVTRINDDIEKYSEYKHEVVGYHVVRYETSNEDRAYILVKWEKE